MKRLIAKSENRYEDVLKTMEDSFNYNDAIRYVEAIETEIGNMRLSVEGGYNKDCEITIRAYNKAVEHLKEVVNNIYQPVEGKL